MLALCDVPPPPPLYSKFEFVDKLFVDCRRHSKFVLLIVITFGFISTIF